jgi:hypothetical protein
VVQPDGIVSLVDLQALRDGTPPTVPQQLTVDRKHVSQLDGGILLCDQNQLYLAFLGLENQADGSSPLFTGQLTDADVDGMLYAFDRGTGTRRWYVPLAAQSILLNRFEELPLILCAAVGQRQKDPTGPPMQTFTTLSIDKRTGKICHSREMLTNIEPFHTLRVDPRTGTIDLLSPRFRLRHTLEPCKP